ncbi:MAG: hypothetical protein OEU46_21495, partial [Alphaproteobacteria bacterium]|nr:hypothetical protein [Alphaproteobacteria bacterium]
MTELRIHQLAAVAMMVSGLLLGLSYISHPHQMPPAVIAGKSWFFIHAGFLASLIIGLLGTTGFYARTMARTGYLGFTGYLLIFIGMILIAGLDYYETLIAPHLAIEFPMVIEKYGP